MIPDGSPYPAAAPIVFQRAGESDLEALAELMNVAYGGTGDVAGWAHVKGVLVGDRTSVRALRAEIQASRQAQLLLVRHPASGALRGTVWLEPRSATVWYLGSLTVDPCEQNAGLGRRILDAAERRLADLGATRVLIDVLNVRDNLLAWYERRGYTPTGESHAFPYEDKRYGVPQRPDLEFLELEKELGRQVPEQSESA